MYKLFNTDELRKNGYIRYPRVFLDMLIRNCCKGKRIPAQIGITVYAIRKGLEDLEQSSVITKKKLDHGMAVEIINYQSFILNKTSYGK